MARGGRRGPWGRAWCWGRGWWGWTWTGPWTGGRPLPVGGGDPRRPRPPTPRSRPPGRGLHLLVYGRSLLLQAGGGWRSTARGGTSPSRGGAPGAGEGALPPPALLATGWSGGSAGGAAARALPSEAARLPGGEGVSTRAGPALPLRPPLPGRVAARWATPPRARRTCALAGYLLWHHRGRPGGGGRASSASRASTAPSGTRGGGASPTGSAP